MSLAEVQEQEELYRAIQESMRELDASEEAATNQAVAASVEDVATAKTAPPASKVEDEDTTVESEEPVAAAASEPAPTLIARFVEHVTLSGRTPLAAETAVTKTWRMRNGGEQDWPRGCRLMHVGGDRMGGPVEGVPVAAAKAGETIDMSVDLVTPSAEGRAVSYWRLVDADGARFGHRVWADIVVAADDTDSVGTAESKENSVSAPMLKVADATPVAAETVVEAEAEAEATETTEVTVVKAAPVDTEAPVEVEAEAETPVVEAQPVATPVSATPYPAQHAALVGMGFNDDAVVAALAASNGDSGQAIHYLLAAASQH